MKKILNIILHTTLVLALLAVAGLSVVSLLPIPGQVEIKIVQSGSMEPAIHTGGIVVIQPADAYAVGDVITFGEDTRVQVPTTHRIIASQEEGGTTYFTTMGDANEDPDAKETASTEVIGRMLFTVPYLGYLIDFSKKPVGFISMVVIPAALIILYELVGVFEEVRKMIRRKKGEEETPPSEPTPSDTGARLLPALFLYFTLPAAVLLAHAGATSLSLYDLERTTGNTFAASLLDLSLSTESALNAVLEPGEEYGHTVIPVLASSDENLPFTYGVHAATEGDPALCGALTAAFVSGPLAYAGPVNTLSSGTTADLVPIEMRFSLPLGAVVSPGASCTVTLTYSAAQEGAAAGTEYHDDEHIMLTFTTPAPPPLPIVIPEEGGSSLPDAPPLESVPPEEEGVEEPSESAVEEPTPPEEPEAVPEPEATII